MVISIIVAVSQNHVIGKDNDLIWKLPKDMKFFKSTTNGHHILMGRKNFESIPHKFRPLPNRTNIVITRNSNYIAKNCLIVNSIEAGIDIAKRNKENELFIIGGGEIYKLALEKNLVHKIYYTKIYHNFKGDTFFPKLDRKEWQVTDIKKNKVDNIHAYDFDFITLNKIT